MHEIAIDTSSILFALERKEDIFEVVRAQFPDYSPILSRGVIIELEKAAHGQEKKAKHAKVAIELIKKHRIQIVENSEYVDNWIYSEAMSGNPVCTNDTALRQKIKREGRVAYAFSPGRGLRG